MPTDKDILGAKILSLHSELMRSFPELSRLAVAIYDKETDLLKTFADSTADHSPIRHYNAKLSDVPSLKALADGHQTRIIDDLNDLASSSSMHSRWLVCEGFRSSYTVPMYSHDHLIGFLFFDADRPKYFDEFLIQSLNIYAELVSSVLINELAPIYTLRGALNTARNLTHHRDNETALHLTRMSHYSYLLAQKLASKHGLSEEFTEYVLQYSPLHDIGKIGIPDHILLKPGKLTAEEYAIIQTHVTIGVDIIHTILREFELADFAHIEILRNVIGCHHERYDGSGYPKQLKADEIPIEGRIVAVADVLDALSHPRPYKKAWSFEDSVSYIADRSATLFDPDCCQILTSDIEDFRQIYETFKEV